MRPDSGELLTFATIVDQGGLAAAARRLGRTRSAVSRDLSHLEARLGVRLLQRTTRRVSLTDEGRVLLGYARRVAEELENAEAAMEALREAPRGHLVASVPFAVLRHLILPELPAFLAAHPELSLTLDPNTRVVDLVEEGVDVAIRVGELPPSSLVARKVGETRVVLAASPAYARRRRLPREAAALAGHDLIDLASSTRPATWQLVDEAGGLHPAQVQPRLAVNEPSLVLDLVERGLGIACLPEVYAAASLAAGRLVRVLPGLSRGVRPIHAVYPSRRLLAVKVRAFIELCERSFARATAAPAPRRGAAAVRSRRAR